MSGTPVFAIIGGSGFYQWEGFTKTKSLSVDTPFGKPSAEILSGEIDGQQCLFLARHGHGHTLLPHEVPYRANIFALKKLGATHVFSVSAVGSMKEPLVPGHLVLPDQYLDFTKQRAATFFGQGVIVHAAMADPVCPDLLARLAAIGPAEVTTHVGGTYVCIEGPQFSTRGESLLYRSFGVSVIGMTNMPEAKLAREAELHYAVLAFPSDYDCWREGEAHVSVDTILDLLRKNTETAKRIIRRTIQGWKVGSGRPCECHRALHRGLMTPVDKLPSSGRALLEVLAPDLLA